jgi:hypothetical protein
MLAVLRPFRQAQISIAGNRDFGVFTAERVIKTQADNARRVMPAVGCGIDAQTSQPQHGLGKIRDWRVSQAVCSQQPFSIWTYLYQRRRTRTKDVRNRLRRFLVAVQDRLFRLRRLLSVNDVQWPKRKQHQQQNSNAIRTIPHENRLQVSFVNERVYLKLGGI